MVSLNWIGDAKGKAPSGLEGLLEIAGFEVMAEGARAGAYPKS